MRSINLSDSELFFLSKAFCLAIFNADSLRNLGSEGYASGSFSIILFAYSIKEFCNDSDKSSHIASDDEAFCDTLGCDSTKLFK